MRITSFPPVVALDARVLILGSMPGAESLRRNQYYAHPRNLFWPIMAELCSFDPTLPYSERITQLQRASFALWDVLQHCEREGSLDTNITDEIPNDFLTFLMQFPTIHTIGLNGQKAAHSFQRLVWPYLPATLTHHIKLLSLPSTSPANARQSKQAKIAQWAKLLSDA